MYITWRIPCNNLHVATILDFLYTFIFLHKIHTNSYRVCKLSRVLHFIFILRRKKKNISHVEILHVKRSVFGLHNLTKKKKSSFLPILLNFTPPNPDVYFIVFGCATLPYPLNNFNSILFCNDDSNVYIMYMYDRRNYIVE